MPLRPATIARGQISAYSVSLVVAAMALGLRLLLVPLLGVHAPFFTALGAVLFAAWYGGTGPALAAMFAGALGVDYFLLEPRHALTVANFDQQLGLFLFLC